jgi:hypothetical protein
MYFVKCFRKHETFCQFVTKRESLLGEMSLSSRLRILFSKLPKWEFVSFNYWLNVRSKITMSVRAGFIAIRTGFKCFLSRKPRLKLHLQACPNAPRKKPNLPCFLIARLDDP